MSSRAKPDKRAPRETNQAVVRQAMLRRLPRRLSADGRMIIPAAPALLDHFTDMLHQAFAALGRVFTEEETEHMKNVLRNKLVEAHAISPYSRVVVTYQTQAPPGTALGYDVHVAGSSVASEYEGWTTSRTGPLFGIHPDAKIMESARSLGAPKDVPVLDVGAGTGRNSLPLAREGFPTDAVELAPALAKILRTEAEKEQLGVRVVEGNALDPALGLEAGRYRMVCMAEVIASHIRTVDEIRMLVEAAARWLVPGGLFVFNAFLAREGYKPDAVARELSQVFWCNLFTKGEIGIAFQGAPFELVSDESSHDFEHEHQPADGWPPTAWYVDWAIGRDLYDLPPGRTPIDLRWLVYRRV